MSEGPPVVLWQIVESLDSRMRHHALASEVPSRFAIANEGNLYEEALALRRRLPTLSEAELMQVAEREARPFVPRLRIDDASYAPDLMREGALYVSAAFREAACLPAGVVDEGPVDMAECAGASTAKDYRTWSPVLTADPIDRDASDGEWIPWIGDDDEMTTRWALAGGPSRPAPRVTFRVGFVPPGPMFTVPDVGWLLVTDELAGRIQSAGLGNVAFVRPDGERGREGLVYRRP